MLLWYRHGGHEPEIVSNLVKAGYPADDIMVVDGEVFVGL